MMKRQVIMLLGAWMAIFLFLGFPPGWDKALAVIAGLLTIGIAYRMGASNGFAAKAHQDPDATFVEHRQSESQPEQPIISNNP